MNKNLLAIVINSYIYTFFLTGLILCFLISDLTHFYIAGNPVKAETIIPLEQLTVNHTRNEISQEIEVWENLLLKSRRDDSEDTAIIHTNLAYAYSQRGEISTAISHLQQATIIYQKSGDEVKLASVLIDRGQAHNSLGQFSRAVPLLEKAISLATRKQDKKTLATAWGVLGNAYSLMKKYDEALDAYQKSFGFAAELDTNYTLTALNNQVSTFIARGDAHEAQAKIVAEEGENEEEARLVGLASQDRKKANSIANQAVQVSLGSNNLSEVKALLNILRIAPQNQYQLRAKDILKTLPDSRSKANSLMKLATFQENEAKINSLEQAISVSSNLNDLRTQSFALGKLGLFYEQKGKLVAALNYTRSAILASQKVAAIDSLYQWQWQLGRIYSLTGAKAKAIDSYRQAIASLQSIRSDIASASTDLQFDVRDKVEPVYRQLVGLLLDSGDSESITEALEVTQLLKLTELQNFFGDECIEVSVNNSPQNAQFDDRAIVTTIILEDKTYVILKANNQVIKYFLIPITSTDFQNKVKKFRFDLENVNTEEYLTLAQDLYNLLLKPIATELKKSNPSKLTFINDGILRNIPMAALHDGKQFLIEKYPIDTTLGVEIKLPTKQKRANEVLIFGLSVAVPPFAKLPNVDSETEFVLNLLGGNNYLNKDFTLNNLRSKIQNNDSPIVHIATHSIFSGTAERTFLQAYDKQVSLKEFEEIMYKRKNPIELLTLSSCKTAAGDNRSSLGLAGVAVRNKVDNVLASLWSLNDKRTVVAIEEFYRQLRQPNISKAEALKNAQVKMIKNFEDSHPATWSAFVLVSR